jgi:hypothetical protein
MEVETAISPGSGLASDVCAYSNCCLNDVLADFSYSNSLIMCEPSKRLQYELPQLSQVSRHALNYITSHY